MSYRDTCWWHHHISELWNAATSKKFEKNPVYITFKGDLVKKDKAKTFMFMNSKIVIRIVNYR